MTRMTHSQLVVLDALEIPRWVQRGSLLSVSSPSAMAEDDAWMPLETEALACTRCELHKTRTRVVFGVGNRRARWLVIGEAPGADEDRQGEPFVGRAGQLLNEMLHAAGVAREQVYIANILKCRPPENRDPKPEESKECSGYLERQIALVHRQPQSASILAKRSIISSAASAASKPLLPALVPDRSIAWSRVSAVTTP